MIVLELALAAWRLAHMLVEEAGPGAVFSRLRYALGVRSVVTKDAHGQPQASRAALSPIAELFMCVWCMSVWTAAFLAIPLAPLRWLRLVLAASGGAVVVKTVIERIER